MGRPNRHQVSLQGRLILGLLPQPGGFEGPRATQKAVYSDGPDVVDHRFHGGTTAAPLSDEARGDEDVVAVIQKLLRFPPEVAESVAHRLEVAANAVVTVECLGIEQFLNWGQIDVGVQVLEDRLLAGDSKGFMATANQLDVLLRHRPRSISPKGAAFSLKRTQLSRG